MKNFADEIIEKYNTCNPYEIAQKIGVVIVAEPLGKVESFYTNGIIHINSDLSEWYQGFVVACQLYNALKNKELKFIVHERYDLTRESIRFAVNLQADREKIEKLGFEEAARQRGVDEDKIQILKERYYKIIKEDE